jgi:ABC-type branched-subunit amino acid transport system substrate-binding protein
VTEAADPGVSEETLTIGIVLDPANLASQAQQKLLGVLAGDIDRLGGVHGRKLTFHIVSPKNAAAEASKVFALVFPQSVPPTGLDTAVPVISVLSASAPSAGAFALVASEADQSAALKRFAAQEWGVVSVKDGCAAKKGDTVLLGSAKCLESAKLAKRVLLTQNVFSSIPPASRKLLPGETFVAFATPLSRVARNAQSAFAQTRARAKNDKSAILAEADAYSAAALLIEALMRTGRDVSREGVIDTLESVRNFEGGMTPPLTFGPNRHVGSRGAEIVRYDPKAATLAGSGTWIDAEPR